VFLALSDLNAIEKGMVIRPILGLAMLRRTAVAALARMFGSIELTRRDLQRSSLINLQ